MPVFDGESGKGWKSRAVLSGLRENADDSTTGSKMWIGPLGDAYLCGANILEVGTLCQSSCA